MAREDRTDVFRTIGQWKHIQGTLSTISRWEHINTFEVHGNISIMFLLI